MREAHRPRWSTAAGGKGNGREVRGALYRRAGFLGSDAKRAHAAQARKLRALAYEVTIAAARERARIAAGLHDDIGQVLAFIGVKLSQLAAMGLPGVATDAVEELRALVRRAVQATRSATFDLSCPLLGRFGLRAALESEGRRMQDLYGLCVEVEGTHPPLFLAEGVLEVLYRVIRELLFNVHKHARASKARVVLQCFTHELVIRVCDDGIGFDPRRLSRGCGRRGGFGLHNARVQMEAIGGRLSVEASLCGGTCIMLSLWLSDR